MNLKLISAGLFVFLGAIVLIVWLGNRPKISVATIDVTGVRALFIRQLAQHKANTAQIKKASIKFNAQFKKALLSYSKKNKVVIVDNKYVLAGSNDITEVITKYLATQMGNAP